MTLTVEVSISDELASDAGELSDDDVPEPELLQSWAEAAYLGETPAVASLLVTTAAEVQSLNKQYRNKDKATNVLSFPMESPAEIDVSLLGDIVLCAPVIKTGSRAAVQERSIALGAYGRAWHAASPGV